jgi:6-pyruvoyltetrahydropterin/6-carboxytetrahydropterin synthase
MLTVTKIVEFEAAHTLPRHTGKCKNLHGHTYRLEVEVERSNGINALSEDGMVVDFSYVKAALAPVIEKMDHSYLNDSTGLEMPTAESMILWLKENVIWPDGVHPVRIRLWETSNSYAEWKE